MSLPPIRNGPQGRFDAFIKTGERTYGWIAKANGAKNKFILKGNYGDPDDCNLKQCYNSGADWLLFNSKSFGRDGQLDGAIYHSSIKALLTHILRVTVPAVATKIATSQSVEGFARFMMVGYGFRRTGKHHWRAYRQVELTWRSGRSGGPTIFIGPREPIDYWTAFSFLFFVFFFSFWQFTRYLCKKQIRASATIGILRVFIHWRAKLRSKTNDYLSDIYLMISR